MRRARSLQQRMQLQQRQGSEAGRQHPEQQQDEGQQLHHQPSAKPLSLQILLTDAQDDQSAASQDQQALPLSPSLVKPVPPKTSLVSDPASSAGPPTGSPREDSRSGGSCRKPLSNTRSLPTLCVDTWEQSPPGDESPSPPPENADGSSQLPKTPHVSLPAKTTPPPRPYSRTPSPVSANDKCHLTPEEPHNTRHLQTTPPVSSSASRLTPPSSARNWSYLNVDQPDNLNSPDPPIYSPSDSPFKAPLPPPQPQWTSGPTSPQPGPDYRAALPVELWAENVNRYYGSQSATGVEGAAALPGEELSELDSLYQASLLAPSMPRGSRGVSPQPTSNKPGARKVMSGSGRSKTPTAEIERFAYRTPASSVQKPPPSEDESYSAENLRRIARSLSGTVIGPRAQNSGPSRSCDPFVSRGPPRHTLLRHPSTSSLHLPSTSSTADHSNHQPRHHGPSAPAPAPQHPSSQASRPPSTGLTTWGHSGPGPGAQQQFLVVSDRHQALAGQNVHSVTLSYGTLPRAPRQAPPPSSFTTSLPRPRAGSSPAPPPGPQSRYATLSHPRLSVNTGPVTNGHHRHPSLPSNITMTTHYAPRPPRLLGEAPAQPRRMDIPPESDWRHNYRTVQPSSSWDPRPTHRYQSLQRTNSHPRPPRSPHLCSLCQQLPVEPSRPYCPSCGAYMARFRPVS